MGLALGVAVPAVVSIGALPAFAAHSEELALDEPPELEPDDAIAMFVDVELLDDDSDLDNLEPGTYEVSHDLLEGEVATGGAEANDGEEDLDEGEEDLDEDE